MKIALNKGYFLDFSRSQLFSINAAAPGGAPARRIYNLEHT